MSIPAVRAALTFAVVAAIAPSLRGQHSAPLIGELDHTTWRIRDGAPGNINALAQSADGVLWIGTQSGLYRFDGVRFESFESPDGKSLPSLAVGNMLALPDTTLWIGYLTGGVSVLSSRGLISYGRADGLPEGSTTAIARDSTGIMWLATTTGLAQLHAGRWRLIGSESRYPGGMTADLLVDRRGTLWAATNDGVFTLRRGTGYFSLQAPSLDPKGSGSGTPRQAPDGSVWGASRTLGLTQLSDSAGRTLPSRPRAEGVDDAFNIFIDHLDQAWLMDASGVLRVPLGEAAMRDHAPTRLPNERVPLASSSTANAVLEDREGNIWIGTPGGLERFRKPKFTPAPLPPTIVNPTLAAGAGDDVWVASISDSLRLIVNVDRRIVIARAEVPAGISCAFRDRSGGLWLGGRAGMWHAPAASSSSAARFIRVPMPDEAKSADVQAIGQTPDEDLWISVRGERTKGVFRRHDGAWTRVPLPSDLAGQLAETIITDDAGRLWLGYTGNRLVRIDGDSLRVYSVRDGLHVGNVQALLARGRRLWIGGEFGLTSLENERFTNVSSTESLRGITGILQTQRGDLWLNGVGGVTRIGAAEIREALRDTAYRASAERFDYHDGIPGEAPQLRPLPSAIQGSDGRLWFTTSTGVSWIDPEHIERNRIVPPVQIRAITAEGKRYTLGEGVRLPKRTTQVQIAYTALSLSIPERVHFRYRLTGVDTSWVDAGTRRQAFYTNLEPGLHRFQVIAANEDNLWNTAGATVDIDIPPTFAQTKLFTVLMVAAALGAVWLLALWRQRQVGRAVQAQFEATLAERTRVARELHDTLLGDMAGVALQLGAVARRIEESAPDTRTIVALLSTLSADVRHSLVEARRTVTDMRAPPDALPPLHEQIASEARRIFARSGIAASVEHEGASTQFAASLQSEIVSIATEAMTNARKHADCRTVTVICRYAPHALQVQVRDDGRGFDASLSTPVGHWGLVGMRERASAIGAELRVTGAANAGTEILLVVPLASAR